MIGGIYESPLAMRAFLKWRDDVDDGTMLLRDIIDLETTYARINGGANEPVISNQNGEDFKQLSGSVKPIINQEVNNSEVKNTDEENEEDEDEDVNLYLVAMESEIKEQILKMIDEVAKSFKEISTLSDRRIARLRKGEPLVIRSENRLIDLRIILI